MKKEYHGLDIERIDLTGCSDVVTSSTSCRACHGWFEIPPSVVNPYQECTELYADNPDYYSGTIYLGADR